MRGAGCTLCIPYTHGVGELGVDLYSLYLIYSGDGAGGGWVSTFVSHILTVGVGVGGGCPLYVILTVQGAGFALCMLYSRCRGLGLPFVCYTHGAGGWVCPLYVILPVQGAGFALCMLYSRCGWWWGALCMLYSRCRGLGLPFVCYTHGGGGAGGALCMLYSRWGWGGGGLPFVCYTPGAGGWVCPLYVILTVGVGGLPFVCYTHGAGGE